MSRPGRDRSSAERPIPVKHRRRYFSASQRITMSLALTAVLIVLPPVIGVAALRALMLRYLTPSMIATAERVVPYILGSLGGFFGLLAGFMLSNSWVELRALRSAMTAEVNAVADLQDIAANLPQPYDDQLRHSIDTYLRTVIDRELPLMAAREVSPATTEALTELWGPLGRFQPQNDAEVSVRELGMEKVMDIGEQRRQRIVFSRERIPGLLWWVLVGSGGVIVIGTCIVCLNYRRPTDVFLGTLTVLVAAVLFSIQVLERPFQYGLSPESSDYSSLWVALGGPQTFRR